MKAKVPQLDKDKFGPWAVVTGASSGIGKEFARQLAASGLHLVLVARRLPELEALGRELTQEFGVEYRVVGADLTAENFIEKIEATTHKLDVGLLVSNAGAGLFDVPGNFLNMSLSNLHQTVRLNAIAHLSLSHYFGRRLAARGRGGVLLVAGAARQGSPYVANFVAAKAYELILGEGLHHEFRKLGLNLTVLCPTAVDTPMVTRMGVEKNLPMKPMSVDQCVAEGLNALKVNRAIHVPGRMNRLMGVLMPRAVVSRMMGRMFEEPAKRSRTGQIS
jgi:short-subunit dehydrogenase